MSKSRLAVGFLVLGLSLLGWGLKSHKSMSPHKDGVDADQSGTDDSAHRAPAAKNNSPSKPGGPEPVKMAGEADEIRKLRRCFESQDCDFAKDDPKSYDIAVGQEIAERLKKFHEKYKGNPQMRADLQKLAREFILTEDGYVQTAALEIFSDLPTSADNVRVLLEGVMTSPDATLVESSLKELRRYLGLPEEAAVHEALSRVMQEGSHFSSQAVARGIAPFLNSGSMPKYQAAASHLSRDTATGGLLHAALDEYTKKRGGG